MGRALATLSGVLVLALLAGGLTEAALARGHHGGIVDDAKLRPAASSTAPTPKATPSPTPTATATPVASPKPTVTPTGPKAVTNSFVHLRAGKSTNTAILNNLDAGTSVSLLPDSDSTWQQVQYAGSVGYIYRAYLTY
jgi:uncharacterized protein YgiM (DUF1202 family)